MNSRRKILLSTLCAIFPSLSIGKKLEMKYAFIVGNDEYLQNPLKNVGYDVIKINDTLKQIGFTTFVINNASKKDLLKSLNLFKKELLVNQVKTVLFYYTGHGFQDSLGQNFLVSIEKDKKELSISSTEIINNLLETNPDFLGIINDTCRTLINEKIKSSSFLMSTKTIIWELFSTTGFFPANDIQFNGASGSPFSYWLSQYISIKNIDIKELSEKIKSQVSLETMNNQIPEWRINYPSLSMYDNKIYLNAQN